MDMWSRIGVLAVVLFALAGPPAQAEATCYGNTCCPPGGPCTTVDPTGKWHEYGEDWRFEIGGGVSGGLVRDEAGVGWVRGGTLMPEVGWRPASGALRVGWQAYRVDGRLNLLAFKWDVATIGPVFSQDAGTGLSVMSTLRVSVLLGNGY